MNRKKVNTVHMFIYVVENLINHKKYVGFHSTDNLNDGYMGSGIALKRAIKKYGLENFNRFILEECDFSNWQERERFWIKELKTFGEGYNLTIGGDGSLGLVLSEETKSKISMANKGREISEEHRKKLSKYKHIAWNKGLKGWCSPELIEKIKLANTGKIPSDETREKVAIHKRGQNNPACRKEVKEKIKKSLEGKFKGDKNPMAGTFRSKDDLLRFEGTEVVLKGDAYDSLRSKIKSIDNSTGKYLIFDGVGTLLEYFKISKNKYYRILKRPESFPTHTFQIL